MPQPALDASFSAVPQEVSNSQFEPPLAIATGLNRSDDRAHNS